VGFVGGGGIGLYLIQWINNADYQAVSSAFIAIGLIVILMDFFSAQLRKQII
jgi:ABC-type phosphate/phosphonate transport system permease subunit